MGLRLLVGKRKQPDGCDSLTSTQILQPLVA